MHMRIGICVCKMHMRSCAEIIGWQVFLLSGYQNFDFEFQANDHNFTIDFST